MVMEFINTMSNFIQSHPALVVMVLAVVEYIKRALSPIEWMRPEYITAVAFIVGVLFAIPMTGFEGIVWLDFIAQGFGLGLVATGLYKVSETISRK
jgi:hypothetical protein